MTGAFQIRFFMKKLQEECWNAEYIWILQDKFVVLLTELFMLLEVTWIIRGYRYPDSTKRLSVQIPISPRISQAFVLRGTQTALIGTAMNRLAGVATMPNPSKDSDGLNALEAASNIPWCQTAISPEQRCRKRKQFFRTLFLRTFDFVFSDVNAPRCGRNG